MNLDRQEILNRLPHGEQRWYDIVNKDGSDGPAEVRIYGTIGGWFGTVTAEQFVKELDEITADEIVCSINSKGGDVFDGIAIYNALRQHSAHVTTKADSLAASIASVIMQAGDHRVMVKSSQMMIHDAWSIMLGNATEMREMADLLEKQDDNIAGIYADRAGDGRRKNHYRSLMSSTTWMTDQEAVDEGLADEVVKPARKSKGDDKPADSEARARFSEHIHAVVTATDELLDRTEEVIAFRSDQGKTPLSGDSLEDLQQLQAALERLTDVVTSAETPPAPEPSEAEAEYLRFVRSEGVN